MSKISLNLSTSVKPAEKFTVDGVEYSLLGLEHLSPEAENTITALFARHGAVSIELGYGPPIDKGEALAERLKRLQNKIIGCMTDLPEDVIETIPMMEKARLFEAINQKYEKGDDEAASNPAGDVRPADDEPGL